MHKDYVAALIKLIREEPEDAWKVMIDHARALKEDAVFCAMVLRWHRLAEEEERETENALAVLLAGCCPIRPIPLATTVTAKHYKAVIRDMLCAKGEENA